MNISGKEYIDMVSDKLPEEITIPKAYCPDCGKELTGLKYKVKQNQSIIIVRTYGVCNNCKLIITCFPIKINLDNNEVSYMYSDNKWYGIKYSILVPLLVTIISTFSWMIVIFGILKGFELFESFGIIRFTILTTLIFMLYYYIYFNKEKVYKTNS